MMSGLNSSRWPTAVSLGLLLATSVLAADSAPHPRAVIQTSQGSFTVELYEERAPRAVENFLGLARQGFYDRTLVHRAVEGLLIQAGDPTGQGYGGESVWGLPFENEIDPSLHFDGPGRLAMANRGRPSTNSSQFFVTVQPAPWFDGDYTIFGQVVSGMDVVRGISEVEVRGADHRPVDDVLLLTVEPEAPSLGKSSQR